MTDAAILVVSCDRYADLWPPFFTLFRTHWPDCPYEVFLGTNYTDCAQPGVTCLQIGDDVDWAANLHRMLDRIPASMVILFLEDFFLTRAVDTARVREMIALAQEREVGCLRLHPHPPPSRRIRGLQGIGEMRRGELYRVSTQTAVWDVRLLRSLARPGFTAWDFELIGSLLSDRMSDRFWGVYEPVFHYCNAVWRGKWLPEGLTACRDAGIAIDPNQRGIFSEDEWARSKDLRGLSRLKHAFLSHMPLWVHRFVRRAGRRRYLRKSLSKFRGSAHTLSGKKEY